MIRCPYCSILCEEEHLELCPLTNEGRCYSCGLSGPFSTSQLAKDMLARCKTCVATNRRSRYMPYNHPCNDIHTLLCKATGDININEVDRLLALGADPNTPSVLFKLTAIGHSIVYDRDGNYLRDELCSMKMCIFRMSDCFLNDRDRQTLVEILERFLQQGAKAGPSLDYYYARYGDEEDGGGDPNFKRMLDLLVSAVA